MKKYCVVIEEIFTGEVVIEAESEDEAIELVIDGCFNGKITFDDNDDDSCVTYKIADNYSEEEIQNMKLFNFK